VLPFGDMSLVENVTGVSELKPYDYFGKLISFKKNTICYFKYMYV